MCFGLGVYAFGNGPHSPSFVSMFRVRVGSDCDVESSRLVRIPECHSVVANVCCHRLSHCGLDWDCMLLEWIGLHSPRFVCDCDIESSRACYHSCSE